MITSGAVSVPLLHPHRRVTRRHAQDHDFAGALAAVQILWHEEYELPPAHAQDLRLLRELG